MKLDTISISTIKKIGPKREKILNGVGLNTISDLLNYYPRKYIDRQTITKIRDFTENSAEITIIVKLYSKKIFKKGNREILNISFTDGSGVVSAVWFKGVSFWKSKLKENEEYILSGKPKFFNGWQFSHPVLEKLENATEGSNTKTGRIISLYPLNQLFNTLNIDSNTIRKYIFDILQEYGNKIDDIIPQQILSDNRLVTYQEALENIHFPENDEVKKMAIRRLKFDELFYLQLILAKRKLNISNIKKINTISNAGKKTKLLYNKLPFELTDAQKNVVKDIYNDLKSAKIMNRMVQGDVGSGKTIVALLAIVIMVSNGYQAAIMAPTEILAEQHYLGFKKFCEDLDINISLLKGKMRKKLKDEVLSNIANGVSNIIVGTHALIQKNVEFQNLGLIVVDEQHRFGVIQRGDLIKKAKNPPNILVMTATPIPRTLSLSVYGDLDVSIINSLPKGRKTIKTGVRYTHSLDKVYNFIIKEIKEGRQAYIVYPLIEKSEKLDIQAAVEGFEDLQHSHFYGIEMAILHGKMKGEEKEEIMKDFKANKTKILISTTVIEVGVDVPNATIMLIMNSERFGLSQIHQLRGRVGRGSQQSYCILNVSDEIKEESMERMRILEQSADGFKISEEDFKLRGPGEFFGQKQSGMPDFKLANLLWDYELMKLARKEAFKLLSKDPYLSRHPDLRNYMNKNYKDKVEFLEIS